MLAHWIERTKDPSFFKLGSILMNAGYKSEGIEVQSNSYG